MTPPNGTAYERADSEEGHPAVGFATISAENRAVFALVPEANGEIVFSNYSINFSSDFLSHCCSGRLADVSLLERLGRSRKASLVGHSLLPLEACDGLQSRLFHFDESAVPLRIARRLVD